MPARKRGYSRQFPSYADTGKRYMLDQIPATFWRDVRAKARRDGTSIRALILRLLTIWLQTEAVPGEEVR